MPASPVSLTVLAVVILCGVHRGVEVQHRWRYMKKGKTNATQGISGDSRPLVLLKAGFHLTRAQSQQMVFQFSNF